MATSAIELSSTVWTRITTAGQSGTCWKKSGDGVLVDHTDAETAATLPLTNTNIDVDKSKRCPDDRNSGDALIISADNVSDIYYAVALSEKTTKIAVDVV